MIKQKVFNYLTLIFAIITILLAINVSSNNVNPIYCIISLITTLLINFFSRKFNNENVDLTQKDREFLKNGRYIEDDKEKTNNKLREKVKKYKERKRDIS